MVDSDTATDAEVDAAQVEYEKAVAAFVELDKTLSAACDSALAESPRIWPRRKFHGNSAIFASVEGLLSWVVWKATQLFPHARTGEFCRLWEVQRRSGIGTIECSGRAVSYLNSSGHGSHPGGGVPRPEVRLPVALAQSGYRLSSRLSGVPVFRWGEDF
jgi:hypothetical protein